MPTDTLKLDVALKDWLIQCCYGVQILPGIIIYIVSNDAAAYIDTKFRVPYHKHNLGAQVSILGFDKKSCI